MNHKELSHDKITIRSFVPEDMEKIIELLEASGWDPQYIIGQKRALEKLIKDKDGVIFIASLKNDILGFIQVQHHKWNGLSQIQGLGVAPDYRRKGIARKLIQQAEYAAHDQGSRGIFLDTPVDNIGGKSFYEAQNYKKAYIMPHYYKDGLDGVTYLKFF